MNNFRVPPGDYDPAAVHELPAGNPNTTLYRQLLLIGIDLKPDSAGRAADTHTGPDHADCARRWA